MLTDIRRAIQQVHDREVGGAVDQEGLQKAVQAAIGRELDVRIGRGRGGSVREVIEANVSSPDAAAPASGCGVAGRVLARLGRVRYDLLVEGEDILGRGTFGVVLSGEYMGQEVAIKKALGIVGDPVVQNDFRSVFSNPMSSVHVPALEMKQGAAFFCRGERQTYIDCETADIDFRTQGCGRGMFQKTHGISGLEG